MISVSDYLQITGYVCWLLTSPWTCPAKIFDFHGHLMHQKGICDLRGQFIRGGILRQEEIMDYFKLCWRLTRLSVSLLTPR